MGCASDKLADSVAKQVSQFSINQSALGQAMTLSQPTQMVSVISVQSSDQKGNQQPRRNRKKGKDNLVPNALSRTFDDHASLSDISMPIPNWLQSVQQGYVNDSSLSQIIQLLASNPSLVPHYSWDGSSLRYKGRLVLPQSTYLHQDVFYELHASPVAGHSRILKIYERAWRNFFWKGMKWEIQQMVAECYTCECHKGETTLLPGLLEPFPIPTRIWIDTSMDSSMGSLNLGGIP